MKKIMRWVSVDEELPRDDMPTLLWGSKLDKDDFPITGRLCSCCGKFVIDMEDETDTVTVRMLGTVTHWLDWTIPEGVE